MSGLKPKIGPKQEAAVLALLSARNVEEAANVAGVTVRTLYRWMKEPEFDAAYRAARRHAYGQSISRLQQGSTAAATTLLKVMVDQATPASTRVRAAEAVLSHAEKAIEIEDIDARLRDLERAAEDSKGNRGMTRSFPRRLQRLETWLTRQRLVRRLDKQGRSPAEIIRERRRIRLAAQGPIRVTSATGNFMGRWRFASNAGRDHTARSKAEGRLI